MAWSRKPGNIKYYGEVVNIPEGVEWEVDGGMLWVRKLNPVTLQESAKMAEFILGCLYNADGDLLVIEGKVYFMLALAMD